MPNGPELITRSAEGRRRGGSSSDGRRAFSVGLRPTGESCLRRQLVEGWTILGVEWDGKRSISQSQVSLTTTTKDLHEVADVLAVRQDLGEVLGAEDVAERGLCEQSRGSVCVIDVRHGDGTARPRTPSSSLSRDRGRKQRPGNEPFRVEWDEEP